MRARGVQNQTRPLAIAALIFMSISAIVIITNSFCIQGDDASRYALGATSPVKELHDPYKLAKEQSFGFFDDIHETTWKRMQQIYIDHENHRVPGKPLVFHPHAEAHETLPLNYKYRHKKGYASFVAWYQNNYEPNFSCQMEKRVGIPMNGDGPKWVCDPHRIARLAQERQAKDPNHPGCVVYSIGSFGDFTFELGLQKEVGEGVCEFHIFDPGDYGGRIPKQLQRAHYHRWGLMEQGGRAPIGQAKPGDGNEYFGLSDIIRKLGHEQLDVIDIFKIDCEMCEWQTFHDWLADDVPMLHQILVEVHKAPKNAVDFFDSLEADGYVRFHKEPNIQWDPSNLEYAFIKLDKSFVENKQIAKARQAG